MALVPQVCGRKLDLMDLHLRLQERLADRFPGVQLPEGVRTGRVANWPHWRYRMPLSLRIAIASTSAALVLFGAIAWGILK